MAGAGLLQNCDADDARRILKCAKEEEPRAMTQALQFDILDLRHFSAAHLKPLLAQESAEWSRKLNWDYRTSIDLILHYLDSRVLPGYVAVEGPRVNGYVFCVYEDAKAVIGDVYAIDSSDGRFSAKDIEIQLLEHLISTLQNSPGTDRIEAQLLLHPSGKLSGAFRAAGFEVVAATAPSAAESASAGAGAAGSGAAGSGAAASSR